MRSRMFLPRVSPLQNPCQERQLRRTSVSAPHRQLTPVTLERYS